jgi:H+/Cl- antiporter ClcA
MRIWALEGPTRLFGYVVGVGLMGGLIGAAYLAALHAMQRVLWPTHWATSTHLLVMAGAGIAVAALTKLLGTPGDVELLVDNIHVLGGRNDIKDLRSLIPVSLVCVASGGAMGPEAPLVQTCGSAGSWLAMRAGLSRDETRILTITGMAAAFTVLFGAPLGSAIFALEILHRRGLEYYEALLPAVLGSLSGYVVYAVLTGAGLRPVWEFPHPLPLRAVDMGWAVLCGIAGAAVATVFTYLSTILRAGFGKVPSAVRPVVGGLTLGALAFWSPYALTFGEAQVDPLVARRAVAGVFVVAALAKLIGASVTLSSGWRGGFIIPLFFIGLSVGRLIHIAAPHTNEVVLMTAMMAAVNVGVTKTPLGSTLVVSEMAGLALAPSTLVAAVVSLFLTSEVGLIHTQRRRHRDEP